MRGALVEGRYRLVDPLGEGTFGSVWRAEDVRLAGRLVAMKFLKAEFLTHPEAVARFESEADALAQVQHPNVVGVFDRGTWEGQRYLATEFVRGRTLRDWLEAHRERGSLPARPEVLAVFDRLCAGVAAAHAVRAPGPIVHRDLKPENVMVDAADPSEPQVKILDFGIAQLGGRKGTQTGALLGTLTYMAPEQGLGDTRAIAPATDVFALGVILVEMLTLRAQPDESGPWWGVALRRGGAVRSLLGALRGDVPPALWDVAARALSTDAGARPADAGALRAEVRAALADRPSLPAAAASTALASTLLAPPPPAPPQGSTTMPLTRSAAPAPPAMRGALVGALVGLLAVAGAATAFVAGRRSAPEEEAPAHAETAITTAVIAPAAVAPVAVAPAAVAPVAVAPVAVAPAGDGCLTRMDLGDNFHLRPMDTTTRAGALELPGGLAVRVLSAGSSWRSGGASRSYRVRVAEGPAAGQEGYVFLHPSDLVGRPDCP